MTYFYHFYIYYKYLNNLKFIKNKNEFERKTYLSFVQQQSLYPRDLISQQYITISLDFCFVLIYQKIICKVQK